jgi:hypothetical protein
LDQRTPSPLGSPLVLELPLQTPPKDQDEAQEGRRREEEGRGRHKELGGKKEEEGGGRKAEQGVRKEDERGVEEKGGWPGDNTENSQYHKEYYKKNREKFLQRQHVRYKKTRDASLRYSQEYYIQNTEKIREKREKNREKYLRYQNEYRQKNRETRLREYQKTREKLLADHREFRCRKYLASGLPPPKKYSSWRSSEEVRIFFRKLSELHFITIWPEDWYRVSLKQVESAGGISSSPRPTLSLRLLLSLLSLSLPAPSTHFGPSFLYASPPSSPPLLLSFSPFSPFTSSPPRFPPLLRSTFSPPPPHSPRNRISHSSEVQNSWKSIASCLPGV